MLPTRSGFPDLGPNLDLLGPVGWTHLRRQLFVPTMCRALLELDGPFLAGRLDLILHSIRHYFGCYIVAASLLHSGCITIASFCIFLYFFAYIFIFNHILVAAKGGKR